MSWQVFRAGITKSVSWQIFRAQVDTSPRDCGGSSSLGSTQSCCGKSSQLGLVTGVTSLIWPERCNSLASRSPHPLSGLRFSIGVMMKHQTHLKWQATDVWIDILLCCLAPRVMNVTCCSSTMPLLQFEGDCRLLVYGFPH